MVHNLDVVNAFLRQRNSKTINNETIKWSISSRASLFQVLPRTLSLILQSVWDSLLAEAETIGNIMKTPETFDAFARQFIAAHVTPDDRYELVQQMREVEKPMTMPAQTFWYKMMEINSCVEWFPGHEPQLTQDQLKVAFIEGMPAPWKDRFRTAGHSIQTTDVTTALHFFRLQQGQAARKMAANTASQKQNARASRRERGENEAKRKHSRSSKDDRSSKRPNMRSNKSIGRKLYKLENTRDDDPCPFHIHLSKPHLWGVCYNNENNQSSPFQSSNADKKPAAKKKVTFAKKTPATETHVIEVHSEPPQ